MGPSKAFADFMLLSIVPLMALVALSDCMSHLSFRIARLFGFRRPDGILLVLTVFAGLAGLTVLFASHIAYWSIYDEVIGVPSYHKPEYEAALAVWRARERLVMLYFYFDGAAILFSIIASVWLALRQKRSVILWFLMGVFGNAGSVIWLIADRRRRMRLVRG
jgi:hypothetical protein